MGTYSGPLCLTTANHGGRLKNRLPPMPALNQHQPTLQCSTNASLDLVTTSRLPKSGPCVWTRQSAWDPREPPRAWCGARTLWRKRVNREPGRPARARHRPGLHNRPLCDPGEAKHPRLAGPSPHQNRHLQRSRGEAKTRYAFPHRAKVHTVQTSGVRVPQGAYSRDHVGAVRRVMSRGVRRGPAPRAPARWRPGGR